MTQCFAMDRHDEDVIPCAETRLFRGCLNSMRSQIARFMGPTWGQQDPGGPHELFLCFQKWMQHAKGCKKNVHLPKPTKIIFQAIHVSVAPIFKHIEAETKFDAISQTTFSSAFSWILIKISLKFVPINNIPTLVQIVVWHRPGDKPLSEPMMVSLSTHICVTRPQWVENHKAEEVALFETHSILRHKVHVFSQALWQTNPPQPK